MMKLKANPKDTASSKQKQRPVSVSPSVSSASPKLMATSPLPQHQLYPSKSIDMSVADGIDSTAPGLNESIISAGSETIDSMREEKKMEDNPSSPAMQHSHYSPNKLAAMRTAQFTIDAENYRAPPPPQYDVSQPQPQPQQPQTQQPQEKPPQHPQSQSPQLFNDTWSSDPWNDTFWSTSSSKPAFHGSRDGQSPTQQQNPDVSFDTLQFQPRIAPSPELNNNNNAAAVAGMDPFGIRLAETFDTTWAANTDIGTHAFSDAAVNTAINTVQSATARQRNFVKVHVEIQERLSILFDEAAKGPICRVVGSIFVKKPPVTPSPQKGKKHCFCLTIRDKKGSIEQWDEASKNTICENITASVPHNAVDPGDQVFMVSLREGQEEGLGAPVVRYTCIPRLRPMPMLLKTKVHRKGSICRVGLRLRSNPQNNYLLTDIAVLMIVPLDMDGSSLSMSRRDGVWGELKRTLTWTIQELPPGELIDIQAQFKVIEGVSSTEASSKFPVLARCNGRTSFSRIDINSDYTEEGATPVELEVSRSTSVLYRKV